MSGSTISTFISYGVTLGSTGFTGPLTITSAGLILPDPLNLSNQQQSAILVPAGAAHPVVVNNGQVIGGFAQNGPGSSEGGAGITAQEAVTLNNTGQISGGAGAGDGGIGGAGSDGIDLTASAAITNSGQISGGSGYSEIAQYQPGLFFYAIGGNGGAGINAAGFSENITNAAGGLITGGNGGEAAYFMSQQPGALYPVGATILSGSGGNGVMLGAGTLTNFGTILGGEAGVEIGSLPPSGADDSTGSGGNGSGVELGGGTLINYGTIAGVDFTSPGLLVAEPGAVFSGALFGGGGTLELAGSAAGEPAMNSIALSGFYHIDFDPGAHWTVSGPIFNHPERQGFGGATYAGYTQTISGFGAGDTLIVESAGFVPSSETYVPGTGLELRSAGASLTLDITGSFTTASFDITSGTNAVTITTGTAPPPPALVQPAHLTLAAGAANAIPGVSVSGAGSLSVTLSDRDGLLSAGGLTGRSLILTGAATQLDTALAGLTDTDWTASPDSIAIAVSGSSGTATGSIAVTVNGEVNGRILAVPTGQSAVSLSAGELGGLLVEHGATALATTLGAGGGNLVFGTARDTRILSGGLELTGPGGVSYNETIGTGGLGVVLPGGYATNATIAGGTELLLAGATAAGDIVFAGSDGQLIAAAAALPVIKGFDAAGSGDEIVLSNTRFVAGDTATLGAGNILTLSLNGTTRTLDLDPAQHFTAKHFTLAANALDQVLISAGQLNPPEPDFLHPAPEPLSTSLAFSAASLIGSFASQPAGFAGEHLLLNGLGNSLHVLETPTPGLNLALHAGTLA